MKEVMHDVNRKWVACVMMKLYGREMRIPEITDEYGMAYSTCRKMMKELDEKGYVETRIDLDRPSTNGYYSLTDEGKEIVESFVEQEGLA